MLAQFGSAEAVLAHTSEIANAKLRAAIEQCVDRVRQNRALMTLNAALPVLVEWDQWRRAEPDRARLAVLFERLGFKSLLQEVRQQQQRSSQEELLLE